MNWLLTHTHQIGFASTDRVEMRAKPARSVDSEVVAAAVVPGGPSAVTVGALGFAVAHPPVPLYSYTSLLLLPYCADSGVPARIQRIVV